MHGHKKVGNALSISSPLDVKQYLFICTEFGTALIKGIAPDRGFLHWLKVWIRLCYNGPVSDVKWFYIMNTHLFKGTANIWCINMLHFIPHKTAPCWFCESFVLQWMRQGFAFHMNKLTGRAMNTRADTYKSLDFRKLSKNDLMLKYSRFPIPLSPVPW